MSTATSVQQQPQAPAQPKLRLLPALGHRPTGKSIALILGVLLVAFVLQLLMVNVIIQDAYKIDSLEDEQVELQREHHAALEAADTAASPQHLAQEATDLGMVPSSGNAYLELASDSIISSGTAGAGAAIDPKTVPNSLLEEDEPETADAEKGEQNGASGDSTPKPAVPSEFEITSPETH